MHVLNNSLNHALTSIQELRRQNANALKIQSFLRGEWVRHQQVSSFFL